MTAFKIGNRLIGNDQPTYFIADIGANHDGDLGRAKMLIALAKECGADAAKFQNFTANKIVSDQGFRALGSQLSHQAKWKKSVFEVYEDASLPHDWTPELRAECERVGIDYFSSAYDFDAVDMLVPHVPAYKIGSGDVDWLEMLEYTAKKGKPVIVATGASTMQDVEDSIQAVLEHTSDVALLQCNTNYTGSDANFDHVHLNVLKTYRAMYPDMILGLSDHTPGHAAVLGAVALGGRIIEKHFTDDNDRDGPDHPFALDPTAWREMVDRTRELERALGSSRKFVADNEKETCLVQRRCVRLKSAMRAGDVITREAVEVLRPATADSLRPPQLEQALGLKLVRDLPAGEALRWQDLAG